MRQKRKQKKHFLIYLFLHRQENLKREREKIGENALADSTVAGRKCYAKKFHFSLDHAISATWDISQDYLIPPIEILTDDNISLYFTHLWRTHNPGKAQVSNGIRYINYALSQYQKQGISRRGARATWPQTFATIQGIKKTALWRETGSDGAKPLTKEEVMKIMEAPIQNLNDLRHKVIAHCYLHMGYHKSDVQRLKYSMLEDHEAYRNRDGCLKPKIVIRGYHNKRKQMMIRNIVACGCSGNHNWTNSFCEYGLWKIYMKLTQKHDDENDASTFPRFNNQRKKKHFVGGNIGKGRILKEVNFLRRLSIAKNRYLHQNMGLHEIGNSLEYWNAKLNLRPDERILSSMARKTFCTLGAKFFKFDTKLLRSVTHHLSDENFELYIHPDYEDLEEESHISVVMQNWAQKKYNPPVHMTPAVMLHELQKNMDSIQQMMIFQNRVAANRHQVK